MRNAAVVVAMVVSGISGRAAAQAALGVTELAAERQPVEGAGTGGASVGPRAKPEPLLTAALALNPPLGWSNGGVGASAYVGFAKHHAIRLNVARYAHAANIAGDLIGIAAGGDGDEAYYQGRTVDAGIGYQHYSRGLYDGLSLEVGVLIRNVDHTTEDEYASPERVVTKGTGVAARAMIGWSWLFEGSVFIAAAAGFSLGHFAGVETTGSVIEMDEQMTRGYSRDEGSFESYIRIGFTWDAGN